ncbi:unnamed protein product [Lupinus luteus]|uniref:Pectinesterase inhibitor domain-containing protein n=1 Tax=Lupinus luteus TaxID=3873 RepID=A0AAV1WHK0_LUPLU
MGDYDRMENDDLIEEEDMFVNIVIIGVSMIMIASITIGLFAFPVPNTTTTGTRTNNITGICRKTDEEKACLEAIKHVGEKGTGFDYVKAAINATRTEFLVLNMPNPLYFKMGLTLLQEQSYRDCLQILELGKEELESLYNMSNSSVNMSLMKKDDANVINSLSAIISYQQTCYDELLQTNSYQPFQHLLKRTIKLTRITLAIVNYFFYENPDINMKMGLDLEDIKHDGYPTWTKVSSIKRKMLEDGFKQPSVVVAQDGSGQFSTITESLNACKNKSHGSCIIHVKKGKYEERVVIPKDLGHVLMYGDGPMNTIVSGINNSKIFTTSFHAATFVVMGKGFICKDMAFTAPSEIIAAPALLVLSDHAAFFNCKIQGNEGTLFAVAQRQFYHDCEIHGNTDIIKGDSSTLIQNSQIIVKPQSSHDSKQKEQVVSAQYKLDKYESTGFVIQNCTIIAEGGNNNSLYGTTYLGSPYKIYSTTLVMESYIGDVINEDGWCEWRDNYGTETATFLEYNNTGPGAKTGLRVSWNSYQNISEKDKVVNYTAAKFIQADQWLQSIGIPYQSSFIFG